MMPRKQLEILAGQAARLLRALELCNASRNRLTPFPTTPDFWLHEADHALALEAAPDPRPEV